jgi:MFS family permease
MSGVSQSNANDPVRYLERGGEFKRTLYRSQIVLSGEAGLETLVTGLERNRTLQGLVNNGPPKSRWPFRWVAYALAVTAFGAGIPTPLYSVYEQQFHFGPGVLGFVFGAYVVGVILTMFFVAPLSDKIGRKPLLYTGMILSAVGGIVFILSTGVLWLAAARIASGLSVGATTSTATAAMAKLEPRADQHHVARVSVAANFGGVSVGILLSGFLVQYAPAPTELVFLVLIGACALGIVVLAITPETVRASGALVRFRIQQVSVPPRIRRPFWVSVGGLSTCYAIYGLYAALAPGFLHQTLRIQSQFATAALVAVMFGSAALVQLALGEVRDRRALLIGFPLIIGALIVSTLASILASGILWVFGAGLLGVGVGFAFMGAVTLVDRVAPDQVRGEVLSGFYVSGYLSLAVPTIGVALAAERVGLPTAGLGFGIVLGLFAASMYVATWRTPTPPGGEGWRSTQR